MERFCGEKQYNYNTRLPTNSNKIELNLKVSPWGENTEERGLTRSSSSVVGERRKKICVPSLERSCSLPEYDKLKSLTNPTWHQKLEGDYHKQLENNIFFGYTMENHGTRHSAEGEVVSKKENESIVSWKTIVKEIPPRYSETKQENPAKKLNIPNYCSLKGDAMEILRQIPSVTTTGDGPNGKRIEGILYNYKSGQVIILCVCHGYFLTPTEFIMHAGGKEVANPLKHITVYFGLF